MQCQQLLVKTSFEALAPWCPLWKWLSNSGRRCYTTQQQHTINMWWCYAITCPSSLVTLKNYWHSGKLRVIDSKTRTCSRINCTIAKLSTTDGRLVAYIGVQLSNEAGKVVVLEIFGQEISGKLWWPPYYESATILSPRDHGVCGRVIHQVVGFCEEGSRHWSVTIVEKQATGLWVVERQWHTVNDVFSHLQNNLWSSIKL